jgi:hypothetical protein
MDKRFISVLISKLEDNIKDVGNFVLKKKISDKTMRLSFGIDYKDIKEKSKIDKKVINDSLIEAHENGLIDIAYYRPQNGILNEWAIIQLTKKDFYALKEKITNFYERRNLANEK